MKHARSHHFGGSSGFTLVESIIVLVLLGIAAAAIISMQGNIFYGQSGNKDIQVGVQLMQECAENILATRRASGYGAPSLADSGAATSSCSGMTLTNPNYGAPTVTITAGSSATIPACPSATSNSCKLVSITQGGLTPVTLMLVSY